MYYRYPKLSRTQIQSRSVSAVSGKCEYCDWPGAVFSLNAQTIIKLQVYISI